VKKKRIIPVLLLRNGYLVQSKTFSEYRNLGNPMKAVERFSQWDADELIYLDISTKGSDTRMRSDINSQNYESILEVLHRISTVASMPITFGGGIRGLEDISTRISRGADKISINTLALENPKFITQASKEFGAQCIVVSVDILHESNKYFVIKSGKVRLELDPISWVSEIESLGAGEVLINIINRDGKGTGYDLDLLNRLSLKLNIPIIALGGAGSWDDMIALFRGTDVDAAAAANIFHFQDQSVYLARKSIFEAGISVRPPTITNL
jgi:cyclase